MPPELAERFKSWAREHDSSTAAALRRLMAEAVGEAPATPRGVGRGKQVSVRFRPQERAALTAAAGQRGMTPAAWLRSLALFRLSGQVAWNSTELDELRRLFTELRRIGSNMNQVAQAANTAAKQGASIEYMVVAGAARNAANEVRAEMRNLVGLMQGQVDYWNGPREAP